MPSPRVRCRRRRRARPRARAAARARSPGSRPTCSTASLSGERGPVRSTRRGRDRVVADGVLLRDGRIAFSADAASTARSCCAPPPRPPSSAPRSTAPRSSAAGHSNRSTGTTRPATAFVALLRAGRRRGPRVRGARPGRRARRACCPEWEHVRFLPQRNAYHRFTVDRHLSRRSPSAPPCSTTTGFDGDVARRARADLLLLGALLHDIGKGLRGDHSERRRRDRASRSPAASVSTSRASTTLDWLVRNHLLLARHRDPARSRRRRARSRASGGSWATPSASTCSTRSRSATPARPGPRRGVPAKAALVRELFLKTDGLLEQGCRGHGASTSDRRETLDTRTRT